MEHRDFYAYFWPGPEHAVDVSKRTAQHANFVPVEQDNDGAIGVLQCRSAGTPTDNTKPAKIPRAR